VVVRADRARGPGRIVIQVPVAMNANKGFFHSDAGRAFNVFCFFTVQSNVIVVVTSLLVAMNPDRSSPAFRVFRLIGVVAITITGIVFHAVLRHLLDLESWSPTTSSTRWSR
jgi:hypothetical protein